MRVSGRDVEGKWTDSVEENEADIRRTMEERTGMKNN